VDLIQVKTGDVPVVINKWELFYQSQLEFLKGFLDNYYFAFVARSISEMLSHPLDKSLRVKLIELRQICEAFDLWDKFQHEKALELLEHHGKRFSAYIINLKIFGTGWGHQAQTSFCYAELGEYGLAQESYQKALLEYAKDEQESKMLHQLTHHDVIRIASVCDDLELPVLIEDSGYKGRHLWFFFDTPVPAKLARSVLKFIAERAGKPSSGIHWEIFPNKAKDTHYLNNNYDYLYTEKKI
jgi:hypothetical protein